MKYFLMLIFITFLNASEYNYEKENISDEDARFIFLSSFLKAFSKKILNFFINFKLDSR